MRAYVGYSRTKGWSCECEIYSDNLFIPHVAESANAESFSTETNRLALSVAQETLLLGTFAFWREATSAFQLALLGHQI